MHTITYFAFEGGKLGLIMSFYIIKHDFDHYYNVSQNLSHIYIRSEAYCK